ncbi:MAG: hypothetical protein QOE57_555 [Acidimicrobiaceae bacterium]|nr:hypothetical protein [Acidimicrobiaceae bacterium]
MAATAGRVLTDLQLNRALLARQLLLKRVRWPLPRVLDAVGGLQAQYAPSMYVGLWSRVDGFKRSSLTAALENRSVIQGTLMRATIHLVSAADYGPFATAVRDVRRSWWLTARRGQVTEDDMVAAARQLAPRLAEGPMSRMDIEAAVGRELGAGIGFWLDLVRVPPSGTWERRRADSYALASWWLAAGASPAADPAVAAAPAVAAERASPAAEPAVVAEPAVAAERATEHLVRRYLGGFGPATANEVADWAGLPVGRILPILRRLDLRHFEAEDGKHLFDLPRAPLPAPGTLAPVRFLPVWEALLLVHARRKRVLADEHRPILFTSKNPHSVNTFLVDGTVAGTWRYDNGQVDVEPFAPLAWAAEREVAQEAERLAVFHQ